MCTDMCVWSLQKARPALWGETMAAILTESAPARRVTADPFLALIAALRLVDAR